LPNQKKKNKTVAIIPAAGTGRRFGVQRNKPFYSLKGKPLLIWPLEVLQVLDEIHEIVPVVKDEDLEITSNLIEQYRIRKVKKIVPGGPERQDSVYNAMKALEPDTHIVLIHDGVRPLLDPALVRKMLFELSTPILTFKEGGIEGIITGVPVKDTIKEVKSVYSKNGAGHMLVKKTLKREALWAVQTPQIFFYDKLKDVHEKAKKDKFYATDDSAMVENYGGVIKIFMGSYKNIKITTVEDLKLAEAFL